MSESINVVMRESREGRLLEARLLSVEIVHGVDDWWGLRFVL